MKAKAMALHYDKLTNDERFKLAVETWSRRDKVELHRIFDTTPKATYRQLESKFLRKWEAGETISHLYFGLFWNAAYKAQSALSLEFVHGCYEAGRDEGRTTAGKKGRRPRKNLKPKSGTIGEAIENGSLLCATAAEMIALSDGYESSCAKQGVNGHKLLQGWIGPEFAEQVMDLNQTFRPLAQASRQITTRTEFYAMLFDKNWP